MTMEPSSERAFVLGLDGVPWGLLRDWVDSGELPAFARLFRDGATGSLTSTTPATTALAWPSIASGVWPDQHGVYAFQRLSQSYSHRMNTSQEYDVPTLWDICSPAIAGNVPMTYPASDIDGSMVAGMLTPESREGFTHPPDLADEIDGRIPDYQIGLDWNEYLSRPEAFLEELDELLQSRRQLMDFLLETRDWRLCFFVFTATDRLQHLVWEESRLLDVYRQIDDILGDVLDLVDELDATLFVVSDHGFGPVKGAINVNTALAREGYLTPRADSGTRGVLSKIGLTRGHVQSLLSTLGITDETLVRHLPRSIVDAVATRMPGSHQLYDIEFSETTAFVHGPGNVYINDSSRFDDGTVAPSDRQRLAAEIAESLGSIPDPDTGRPVLEVHDGESLFPRDARAPDLVISAKDYTIRTGMAHDIFESAAMAGDHRHEGIFLAYGPDIEPGAMTENASVVDVAPTVLQALGHPIPEMIDGRVLDEIFREGSHPATNGVETYAYSADGEDGSEATVDTNFDDVEERLRGLGYME